MKKKGKYNLTTIFALPLCGHMRAFYEPFLIDAYIKDNSIEKYSEYHIFIVLKYNGNKGFMNLEKILNENGAVSYDLYGGEYVVFIREIKDCFKDDFEAFKEGRYSDYSDPGQRAIKASVDKKSSVPLIFKKSPKVKSHWENKWNIPGSSACVYIEDGMEVWPILDIEKETFYKNKLTAKEQIS